MLYTSRAARGVARGVCERKSEYSALLPGERERKEGENVDAANIIQLESLISHLFLIRWDFSVLEICYSQSLSRPSFKFLSFKEFAENERPGLIPACILPAS